MSGTATLEMKLSVPRFGKPLGMRGCWPQSEVARPLCKNALSLSQCQNPSLSSALRTLISATDENEMRLARQRLQNFFSGYWLAKRVEFDAAQGSGG